MSPDSILERWPVVLRDWIVGPLPEPWNGIASGLLIIIAILTVFGLGFAFTTVIERKLIGRFQNRLGPNRVGPFGLGQPFADAVKTLTKEDIVPLAADKVLHFLAPCVLVAFSLMALAIVPVGRHLVPVELDAGLLYFFAAGAGSELAVFMAGWSSRNKYALFAAMRALAQLISYELPLLLCTIPVVLIAGTLSLPAIVEQQGVWSAGGLLPHWNVFTPWGALAFLIFFIAAFAEANRSPFDTPEAESEIVAGHFTEYSGFKFALFFMAEYFGLFALGGVMITLFLGGWQAPCEFLQFIPSYGWFALKLASLLFLFIWIRATLLRVRIDQLQRFAWKFLVPLALINIGNAAFWSLTADWSGPAQLARWAISFVVAVVPFVVLGRRLTAGLAPRTYRYAS